MLGRGTVYDGGNRSCPRTIPTIPVTTVVKRTFSFMLRIAYHRLFSDVKKQFKNLRYEVFRKNKSAVIPLITPITSAIINVIFEICGFERFAAIPPITPNNMGSRYIMYNNTQY